MRGAAALTGSVPSLVKETKRNERVSLQNQRPVRETRILSLLFVSLIKDPQKNPHQKKRNSRDGFSFKGKRYEFPSRVFDFEETLFRFFSFLFHTLKRKGGAHRTLQATLTGLGSSPSFCLLCLLIKDFKRRLCKARISSCIPCSCFYVEGIPNKKTKEEVIPNKRYWLPPFSFLLMRVFLRVVACAQPPFSFLLMRVLLRVWKRNEKKRKETKRNERVSLQKKK